MKDKNKNFKEKFSHLKPYLESVKTFFKTIWEDPLGKVGAIIFSFIILMAVFAPYLTTYEPFEMVERREGGIIETENNEWESYQIVGETPFNDLIITSEGDFYALGEDGKLYLKEDDDTWQSISIPTDNPLKALGLAPTGEFLVGGEKGTLLMYEDGDWLDLSLDRDATIAAIEYSLEGEVLIAGENGLLFRGDKGDEELQTFDSTVDRHLSDISFYSQGKAVIVGDSGTILHYKQGEIKEPDFRSIADDTFRDLTGVDLTAEGTGYVVGERGTILGFDGQEWYAMNSPESRELRDVAVLETGEAYALGIRGIMLYHSGADDVQWESRDLDTNRDLRGISSGEDIALAFGSDPYINSLATPSSDHLFGTTSSGRDVWSQVLYGSRTALFIGVTVALLVNLIGISIGLIAGYYKGIVDNLLMRFVDIMYGLPLEPFAIILVLIFEPSLRIVIFSIALLTWRTNARIIRSQVLSLAERPFIKAARASGASDLRIMVVHIAPNILPLAFLQLAVAMGYAITAEASLSFLGLGPPRIISWGTMLHRARLSGAWRVAWWWVIPPGIFICLTVVSAFLISRALEVLTNPRLRGGNNDAPKPEES